MDTDTDPPESPSTHFASSPPQVAVNHSQLPPLIDTDLLNPTQHSTTPQNLVGDLSSDPLAIGGQNTSINARTNQRLTQSLKRGPCSPESRTYRTGHPPAQRPRLANRRHLFEPPSDLSNLFSNTQIPIRSPTEPTPTSTSPTKQALL